MKGIGFAGLGKALAENTLSLLKGTKTRSADSKLQDNRLSSSSTTNYDMLMQWQRDKRRLKRRNRTIFYIGITLFCILGLILHFAL